MTHQTETKIDALFKRIDRLNIHTRAALLNAGYPKHRMNTSINARIALLRAEIRGLLT